VRRAVGGAGPGGRRDRGAAEPAQSPDALPAAAGAPASRTSLGPAGHRRLTRPAARGRGGGRRAGDRAASLGRRPAGDGAGAARFAALKRWRLEESRSGGVPAYVVFSNRTLEEIARVDPETLGELAVISGVGPAKLESYGERVLAELGAQSHRLS